MHSRKRRLKQRIDQRFPAGDRSVFHPSASGIQQVVYPRRIQRGELNRSKLLIAFANGESLLPGLLLARVDGKSPAEYLTRDSQRETVRAFAKQFLQSPPGNLADLRQAWQKS